MAVIMLVLLFFPFQIVDAHKPLEVEEGSNKEFSTAKEIPNHRISWAIYEELSESNRLDYYKFAAKEGERLYVQMSIPRLEKFSEFAPSIALVGRDLSASVLEKGHSGDYVKDIMDLPFVIPPGMNAIVVDYNEQIPSSEFYESFTQTSYWERQEIVIKTLPSEGTYYLVVFDEHMQSTGKYTLAVGEIEDFTPLDFFTVLPAAWFDTKFFFEDYVTPALAISLLVAVPILIAVLLVKRLIRRREPKSPSQW